MRILHCLEIKRWEDYMILEIGPIITCPPNNIPAVPVELAIPAILQQVDDSNEVPRSILSSEQSDATIEAYCSETFGDVCEPTDAVLTVLEPTDTVLTVFEATGDENVTKTESDSNASGDVCEPTDAVLTVSEATGDIKLCEPTDTVTKTESDSNASEDELQRLSLTLHSVLDNAANLYTVADKASNGYAQFGLFGNLCNQGKHFTSFDSSNRSCVTDLELSVESLDSSLNIRVESLSDEVFELESVSKSNEAFNADLKSENVNLKEQTDNIHICAEALYSSDSNKGIWTSEGSTTSTTTSGSLYLLSLFDSEGEIERREEFVNSQGSDHAMYMVVTDEAVDMDKNREERSASSSYKERVTDWSSGEISSSLESSPNVDSEQCESDTSNKQDQSHGDMECNKQVQAHGEDTSNKQDQDIECSKQNKDCLKKQDDIKDKNMAIDLEHGDSDSLSKVQANICTKDKLDDSQAEIYETTGHGENVHADTQAVINKEKPTPLKRCDKIAEEMEFIFSDEGSQELMTEQVFDNIDSIDIQPREPEDTNQLCDEDADWKLTDSGEHDQIISDNGNPNPNTGHAKHITDTEYCTELEEFTSGDDDDNDNDDYNDDDDNDDEEVHRLKEENCKKVIAEYIEDMVECNLCEQSEESDMLHEQDNEMNENVQPSNTETNKTMPPDNMDVASGRSTVEQPDVTMEYIFYQLKEPGDAQASTLADDSGSDETQLSDQDSNDPPDSGVESENVCAIIEPDTEKKDTNGDKAMHNTDVNTMDSTELVDGNRDVELCQTNDRTIEGDIVAIDTTMNVSGIGIDAKMTVASTNSTQDGGIVFAESSIADTDGPVCITEPDTNVYTVECDAGTPTVVDLVSTTTIPADRSLHVDDVDLDSPKDNDNVETNTTQHSVGIDVDAGAATNATQTLVGIATENSTTYVATADVTSSNSSLESNISDVDTAVSVGNIDTHTEGVAGVIVVGIEIDNIDKNAGRYRVPDDGIIDAEIVPGVNDADTHSITLDGTVTDMKTSVDANTATAVNVVELSTDKAADNASSDEKVDDSSRVVDMNAIDIHVDTDATIDAAIDADEKVGDASRDKDLNAVHMFECSVVDDATPVDIKDVNSNPNAEEKVETTQAADTVSTDIDDAEAYILSDMGDGVVSMIEDVDGDATTATVDVEFVVTANTSDVNIPVTISSTDVGENIADVNNDTDIISNITVGIDTTEDADIHSDTTIYTGVATNITLGADVTGADSCPPIDNILDVEIGAESTTDVDVKMCTTLDSVDILTDVPDVDGVKDNITKDDVTTVDSTTIANIEKLTTSEDNVDMDGDAVSTTEPSIITVNTADAISVAGFIDEDNISTSVEDGVSNTMMHFDIVKANDDSGVTVDDTNLVRDVASMSTSNNGIGSDIDTTTGMDVCSETVPTVDVLQTDVVTYTSIEGNSVDGDGDALRAGMAVVDVGTMNDDTCGNDLGAGIAVGDVHAMNDNTDGNDLKADMAVVDDTDNADIYAPTIGSDTTTYIGVSSTGTADSETVSTNDVFQTDIITNTSTKEMVYTLDDLGAGMAVVDDTDNADIDVHTITAVTEDTSVNDKHMTTIDRSEEECNADINVASGIDVVQIDKSRNTINDNENEPINESNFHMVDYHHFAENSDIAMLRSRLETEINFSRDIGTEGQDLAELDDYIKSVLAVAISALCTDSPDKVNVEKLVKSCEVERSLKLDQSMVDNPDLHKQATAIVEDVIRKALSNVNQPSSDVNQPSSERTFSSLVQSSPANDTDQGNPDEFSVKEHDIPNPDSNDFRTDSELSLVEDLPMKSEDSVDENKCFEKADVVLCSIVDGTAKPMSTQVDNQSTLDVPTNTSTQEDSQSTLDVPTNTSTLDDSQSTLCVPTNMSTLGDTQSTVDVPTNMSTQGVPTNNGKIDEKVPSEIVKLSLSNVTGVKRTLEKISEDDVFEDGVKDMVACEPDFMFTKRVMHKISEGDEFENDFEETQDESDNAKLKCESDHQEFSKQSPSKNIEVVTEIKQVYNDDLQVNKEAIESNIEPSSDCNVVTDDCHEATHQGSNNASIATGVLRIKMPRTEPERIEEGKDHVEKEASDFQDLDIYQSDSQSSVELLKNGQFKCIISENNAHALIEAEKNIDRNGGGINENDIDEHTVVNEKSFELQNLTPSPSSPERSRLKLENLRDSYISKSLDNSDRGMKRDRLQDHPLTRAQSLSPLTKAQSLSKMFKSSLSAALSKRSEYRRQSRAYQYPDSRDEAWSSGGKDSRDEAWSSGGKDSREGLDRDSREGLDRDSREGLGEAWSSGGNSSFTVFRSFDSDRDASSDKPESRQSYDGINIDKHNRYTKGERSRHHRSFDVLDTTNERYQYADNDSDKIKYASLQYLDNVEGYFEHGYDQRTGSKDVDAYTRQRYEQSKGRESAEHRNEQRRGRADGERYLVRDNSLDGYLEDGYELSKDRKNSEGYPNHNPNLEGHSEYGHEQSRDRTVVEGYTANDFEQSRSRKSVEGSSEHIYYQSRDSVEGLAEQEYYRSRDRESIEAYTDEDRERENRNKYPKPDKHHNRYSQDWHAHPNEQNSPVENGQKFREQVHGDTVAWHPMVIKQHRQQSSGNKTQVYCGISSPENQTQKTAHAHSVSRDSAHAHSVSRDSIHAQSVSRDSTTHAQLVSRDSTHAQSVSRDSTHAHSVSRDSTHAQSIPHAHSVSRDSLYDYPHVQRNYGNETVVYDIDIDTQTDQQVNRDRQQQQAYQVPRDRQQKQLYQVKADHQQQLYQVHREQQQPYQLKRDQQQQQLYQVKTDRQQQLYQVQRDQQQQQQYQEDQYSQHKYNKDPTRHTSTTRSTSANCYIPSSGHSEIDTDNGLSDKRRLIDHHDRHGNDRTNYSPKTNNRYRSQQSQSRIDFDDRRPYTEARNRNQNYESKHHKDTNTNKHAYGIKPEKHLEKRESSLGHTARQNGSYGKQVTKSRYVSSSDMRSQSCDSVAASWSRSPTGNQANWHLDSVQTRGAPCGAPRLGRPEVARSTHNIMRIQDRRDDKKWKDGPLSLTDTYGPMDNHNDTTTTNAGSAHSPSANHLSGSMASLSNRQAPASSPSRQNTLQKQQSLQSTQSEVNGGQRDDEGIKFERLKNLTEDDLMAKIKEIIGHFEKLEEYHRGDGMRIQKMLGDMYWDYPHMREMVGDCMAENGYAVVSMTMLKTLNGIGIFKNDDVWFPTYYTYNTMWNFTDASSTLAKALSEHDAVRLLTLNCGHKPYINAIHSKNVFYVIKASLSILHNIARNTGMKHLFDENKTSEVIMPFIESEDEMLKILATLTISNIVDEEENKSLIAETGTIHCIISWIEKALGLPRRRYKGFTPQELTEGLNKLAVNDSNKMRIIEEGALPLFLKMLQHDDVREQSSAARVIWTLSFDKDVRQKINDSPELLQQLQKLTESTNKSLQTNTQGALWVIRGDNDVTKESRPRSAKTKTHVFLSYSWSDKEAVLLLRDRLRAEGYAIWIDIEKMGGSTLEAMATAVENSAVVLMCMSEKYKQSPNCRTEAEYTFQLRKDYIPLMLQKRYRPDGWLGLILGAKLYFDFSGKYPFDKSFQGLLKELRGRGKVTPDQTPGEVNDHVDAAFVHSVPPLSSHPSAGTPIHQMSTNSAIFSMGQEELIKWLRNIKLTECIPAFMEFDGKLLMQLKHMRLEAPEFFYQCLEKRMNMSLIEILKFTRALEELH